MKRLLGVAALAIVASIAAPRAAAAGSTLKCTLAEPGSIDVDGMLDDWNGVTPSRAGGKDKDTSFDVRCLYDGERLALSIDVRDDYLVRLFKAKGKAVAGDDRIELALRAGGKALTLQLFPGSEHMTPRRLVGGITGKKPGAWLSVEDTQQPKGWSIELELPLAKIPGWSAAAPAVDASVTFHDADSAEDRKTQDALAHDVALSLGSSSGLFDRFLRDVRLKQKDLVLDQMADLDPSTPGEERVVAGGIILGVIADKYAFVELPVAAAADILKMQLVDLRGDGSKVVIAHLRQHGGGGSRDVITGWGASGGQIEQLFAVEIRKEADGNRLESTWQLVKAGTRRTLKKKAKARGIELVVEARPAVGWDEDSFEEVQAEDAEPIHLPWDDARIGGVYWLDGTTLRSQPLARKVKKGRSRTR